MPSSKPFALLVVPDDEPPALAGTPLEARAQAPNAGSMAYNGTMHGLGMSIENLEKFAGRSPVNLVTRGARSR